MIANQLESDRAAKLDGCSESKFSSYAGIYYSYLPKKLFLPMQKYKLHDLSLTMRSVLKPEADSRALQCRNAMMPSTKNCNSQCMQNFRRYFLLGQLIRDQLEKSK